MKTSEQESEEILHDLGIGTTYKCGWCDFEGDQSSTKCPKCESESVGGAVDLVCKCHHAYVGDGPTDCDTWLEAQI